jgi:uncharacterized protein (TIGR02246 family)
MSAQTGHAQISNDEQAIRQLVDRFLAASKEDDLDTVLALLADDVIFMVPGREPFGKEEFAAQSKQNKGTLKEAIGEIQEIKVLGDWAWMRNHLDITITPPNGKVMRRAGYVLTVLRKNADGRWVISRDANLLTPKE